MNQSDQKTVVITGASAGIGAATALLLAARGYRVYALARRDDRLKALSAAAVQQKMPGVICPVAMDLLKDLSLLDEIVTREPVDILINNAGLSLGRNSIEKMPMEDWQTVIDTNIKALIAVTQKVLPGMIERNSGDIVNLGSIAGYETYATGSVYNATKFAVRALTEAWRKDLLGKNIRVLGIHPGMVETEFSIVRTKGDRDEAAKVYAGMSPLRAEDIAETIIWCLERPRHITIQSLLIMPTDQASAGLVSRKP